ncbi:MAG: hypothetical protein Q8936_21640 [Bacillota bacterium]|nr:hypothetical protein [Bacillota bacterium]
MRSVIEKQDLRDINLENDVLTFGDFGGSIVRIELNNKEKQDLTKMLLESLYQDQQTDIVTEYLNNLDVREFEKTMNNVVEYTSNTELEDRVVALSEQVENLEETLEQFEEYSNPVYRQEIF